MSQVNHGEITTERLLRVRFLRGNVAGRACLESETNKINIAGAAELKKTFLRVRERNRAVLSPVRLTIKTEQERSVWVKVTDVTELKKK